jgi:nitrous oxidase accessory protein NosD
MSTASSIIAVLTMLAAASATIAVSDSATLQVCAAGDDRSDCRFRGDLAIQAAVDAAADGDTVLVRAGRYAPAAFRDVPYKEVTIRGYVVVDAKSLTLAGEPGAVLDGSSLRPTTAIVVRRGEVAIRDLEITGFRYDVEEDDTYEGHGVFVIDGRARLDGVTIRRFQKMGLTGRGSSRIEASRVRLLDGHVGVWLAESAYLRLHDAVIAGNDSAAIAAYGNSVAHVSNAAIDGNRDDGLFADEQAAIFATNSLILNNAPVGANAIGRGQVWLGYSALRGNGKDHAASGEGRILLGPGLILDDPQLDPGYRRRSGSPLNGRGDPDLGNPPGTSSQIGPSIGR